MDQQEKNLHVEPEADDEPAPKKPGAKEDNDD
jgi:hypothetical protein